MCNHSLFLVTSLLIKFTFKSSLPWYQFCPNLTLRNINMLRSQIGAKACKMVRVGQVILTKQVGEVKLAKVRAQNMKLDTRLMMVNIAILSDYCNTYT